MFFDATRGPVRATKTLNAIAEAMMRDGGNLFRALQRELLPQAEDAYRQEEGEPFRPHLGCSRIGRECPREIWYSLRWATHPRDMTEYHDGQCFGPPASRCPQCAEKKARMLRLWNRGHLEEARMVALLRMVGCRVWQFDESGNQFRVSYHDGHYGGSLDGVALGVPDDPEQPLLCEFKTHNEKSFDKLVKEGVRSAKHEHFVQMQEYMGGYSLRRGIYVGVSKNTDDLWAELVDFDQEQYLKYLDRAKFILLAGPSQPPKKINESPGWYTCRFCDQRLVCHQGGTPYRSCRSCSHSRPGAGGLWYCTHPVIDAQYGDNAPLDKRAQLEFAATCEFYDRAF